MSSSGHSGAVAASRGQVSLRCHPTEIDLDHSAATTVESSPRHDYGEESHSGNSSAKWRQVRDILVKAALNGDEVLHSYGDMITCKETIERFLAGAKGNVEKAAKQLQGHLEWRREYQYAPHPKFHLFRNILATRLTLK
jgi:hypothetical protein